MSPPSWLASLAAGDPVLVRGPERHQLTLHTVTRVTDAFLQVNDLGARFSRTTGERLTGDRGHAWYALVEATPQERTKFETRALAERLARHDWQRTPGAVLERVAAVIEAGEGA